MDRLFQFDARWLGDCVRKLEVAPFVDGGLVWWAWDARWGNYGRQRRFAMAVLEMHRKTLCIFPR